MSFYTFEGGEGSGKSTQAKLLHQAFEQAKIEAVITREPGGTDSAEEIRNLLLHGDAEFYPVTQLLLHNASRYEHAKLKIIPAINSKKIVICDRFVDSTMAYQGYGHKLGKKLPALLHNMFMEGLAPDLTFILDIDPTEGLKRAKDRAQHDNYEKLDLAFHTRVRNGFLDIATMAKNRCVVIEADNEMSNIHHKIIKIVNERANIKLQPVV
jgi:dTMP kinase